MQTKQVTEPDTMALRIAYERCSYAMREAVGSFEMAMQNAPVRRCMELMAKTKRGRDESATVHTA